MNEVNQVTIIFTQIKHNSIKSNLFVPSLNVSVAKSMTKSRSLKQNL
ncbi:MAG: hypothetical protein E6721_08325 [Staphylococcus epidermidis]|nr:hypothetical protein [Staphylococcus epidermidis]